MVLWYGIIILFAFLSLLIDLNYLPQQIMRHVWNLLIFGVGVYLLVRIKRKEKVGMFEALQKEYLCLRDQEEEQRFTSLQEKIENLEGRLAVLEGK